MIKEMTAYNVSLRSFCLLALFLCPYVVTLHKHRHVMGEDIQMPPDTLQVFPALGEWEKTASPFTLDLTFQSSREHLEVINNQGKL